MYCGICNNPILARNMPTIPRGKDTASCSVQCPYCRRIYSIAVTVLKETDMTEEAQKELLDIQRSR